jgi:hypothetical protein
MGSEYSFVADKPRMWSEKKIGWQAHCRPDAGRGPEDQRAQNHVIFLQNFFDEVRRRTAAAGK